MVLQRLKTSCKLISVGIGIMSSYLTYQYQRTLGADMETVVNKNISDVQQWFQWKSKKAYELTEEYLIQYCRQFSASSVFHQMEITSFLIYLANSKSMFIHQLGVKLLSTVQFPDNAVLEDYIKKCDYTTLIGLARSKDIQSNWFPDGTFDDTISYVTTDETELEIKKNVEDVLNNIRAFVPSEHEDCSSWLYEQLVFQKLPDDPFPNAMVDLCTERDTLDLSKPEQPCPFRKNIRTYLEILRGYSNNELVASNPLLSLRILRIVREIIFRFEEHNDVLLACGNIIANLACHENNRIAIVDVGLLPVLMKWKKSNVLFLKIVANRILYNLDALFHSYQLSPDGIYVLNPDSRADQAPDVDVIFVHGIHGNTFYTWRQSDSCKEEKYTYCWPKEWLCVDCPKARVICVQYESYISDWLLSCPIGKDKYSLDVQAENIKRNLKKCGVGDKPIVWVAHSMGGLIVEKLLLSESGLTKNQCENILSLTEGIIFYSVPHLGSPIATKSEKARYILFPSVEVHELSGHSTKLIELHSNFDCLREKFNIKCVDFGETLPLILPVVKMKTMVVPESSSNVGYGRYIPIDANHSQVCKPASKNDPRYTEVVTMVKNAVKSNETVTKGGH